MVFEKMLVHRMRVKRRPEVEEECGEVISRCCCWVRGQEVTRGLMDSKRLIECRHDLCVVAELHDVITSKAMEYVKKRRGTDLAGRVALDASATRVFRVNKTSASRHQRTASRVIL